MNYEKDCETGNPKDGFAVKLGIVFNSGFKTLG